MDHNALLTADPGRADQTVTVVNREAAAQAPRRPCVGLVTGSGTHMTAEVGALLRHRLRIAGVIGLAGFAAFFLKSLVHETDFGPTRVDLALHAVLVAVLVMACTLLWTHVPLTTAALRRVELVLFGSMALFFAYLQFSLYAGGRILHGIPREPAAVREQVVMLANFTNATRWFILIVLYGMFIPNTWRRSALVVGGLALTPLLLSVAVCLPCSEMGPYTGPVMYDQTVVLALGASMAIFGSYKINELQAEAYQARKLGQYRLHRKLGAGGMGEVYLGEHVLLRRACAVKLIRADQAGDCTTLGRFEREVQAMATLTHWNTVEVYDYGRAEDGTFYYVMEYLPGLSLQDLVDRHGPLTPARAVHFLRQVCAALREAHAVGLIHRDIKPSNVIACQRGGVHDVAKLLDFGLVHDIGFPGHDPADTLTAQGTILGSPPYIAPEQARGRGDVDARTDIYSLGGLAYFLLTGQAPFVRDGVMELLVAHLHDAPVPPRDLRPEVPADVEAVILKCLQKKPEDRFPDAESLDRALAACDVAGAWDADQAQQWWREQAQAEITARDAFFADTPPQEPLTVAEGRAAG